MRSSDQPQTEWPESMSVSSQLQKWDVYFCAAIERLLFLVEVNKKDWKKKQTLYTCSRGLSCLLACRNLSKIFVCIRSDRAYCCALLFTKIKYWLTVLNLVQCIFELSPDKFSSLILNPILMNGQEQTKIFGQI